MADFYDQINKRGHFEVKEIKMTRDEAIKRVGCSGFNLDVLNVIESLGLIEFEKVDKRQELIKEARSWIGAGHDCRNDIILRLISELEKK